MKETPGKVYDYPVERTCKCDPATIVRIVLLPRPGVQCACGAVWPVASEPEVVSAKAETLEAQHIVLSLLRQAYSYKTDLEMIAYYAALYGGFQNILEGHGASHWQHLDEAGDHYELGED